MVERLHIKNLKEDGNVLYNNYFIYYKGEKVSDSFLENYPDFFPVKKIKKYTLSPEFIRCYKRFYSFFLDGGYCIITNESVYFVEKSNKWGLEIDMPLLVKKPLGFETREAVFFSKWDSKIDMPLLITSPLGFENREVLYPLWNPGTELCTIDGAIWLHFKKGNENFFYKLKKIYSAFIEKMFLESSENCFNGLISRERGGIKKTEFDFRDYIYHPNGYFKLDLWDCRFNKIIPLDKKNIVVINKLVGRNKSGIKGFVDENFFKVQLNNIYTLFIKR